MLKHLPKWIEYGAFLLALVAGYVNAIGFLGFEHQSVSHLSGTATLLGTQLLRPSGNALLPLIGALLSFLLGSVLAGLLLHGSALKLGRHYDTALFLEGALLLVSLGLLSRGSWTGHLFASAACGLQNALATTYSGAIIRTTHVTGLFTDLGILIGGALRGQGLDRRKALLFGIIISGFVLGGTVGAFSYSRWQFLALSVPAGICFLLAGVYRYYSRLRR